MQRISLEISPKRRERALLGQLEYQSNINNVQHRRLLEHDHTYTYLEYHPAEWRRSLQRIMEEEGQEQDGQSSLLMTPIELSNCHLVLYSGIIALGSNRQRFRVDFDTASSDLWVAGINCTDCHQKHATWHLFNATASSTFEPTSENTEFNVQYDDGEMVRTGLDWTGLDEQSTKDDHY
jgi:Eukaryotic aspartyl protease